MRRGYVLRGEERYFQEQALELIRGRAEKDGFEVCVHDAKRPQPDFSLSALIDDLSGGGLFAAARLVVLRNPEDPLKKVGGKPSPLTHALQAFVSDAQNPGCVVLCAGSIRLDHAAVKAIVAADGSVFGMRKLWDAPPPWNPDPRQAELVQWFLQLARTKGVRLQPAQAVYVCAATGNDLFALEDKLELLRRAPAEEIQRIVPWDASMPPWTVADTIVDGEAPRALAGIETVFRGGFQDKSGRRTLDPTALSSMLVGSLNRGVRQCLLVADALERGESESAAVRVLDLGGRKAAAQATLARAKKRSARAWRAMLADVQGLERSSKSGGDVEASAFTRFALRWKV